MVTILGLYIGYGISFGISVFILVLIIKVLILAIKRLQGGNPRHYGRRRSIRGAK